ncbi:hypothetical protein GGX14DRAFT_643538 [Mycena pura]|uniref:BTB domain-containing protein n=1 Tax=Mycena pura TaxID=153505 RepID=A0AAD6VD94_9AGAR|nr:hypothetical protein GGX14DRAFT_643538 [Mycena pura]
MIMDDTAQWGFIEFIVVRGNHRAIPRDILENILFQGNAHMCPITVFVPTYPFAQTPDADAILRSRDGADFYIHTVILSLVSPVFETMFSLPQSLPTSAIPIIHVQENSISLDRALRFFYPPTQPLVVTFLELQEIIEILVSKYDMQSLAPMVKHHLGTFITSHPVGVYAVAFMHGWEDVGRAAAKECLKLPLREAVSLALPEINTLTTLAYHNLPYYHSRCAAAAKGTTQDLEWITIGHCPWRRDKYCWLGCKNNCHSESFGLGAGQKRLCLRRAGLVSPWFVEFVEKIGCLLAVTPGIIDQDSR